MRLCGEAPPVALVERVSGGAFACSSWLSASCELGEARADAAKRPGAALSGGEARRFACLPVDEANGDALAIVEVAASHSVSDGCRVVGARM